MHTYKRIYELYDKSSCHVLHNMHIIWAGCSLPASQIANPVGLVLKIELTPK